MKIGGKPVEVYNTVAEIRGTEKPDEVVIIGAHLDSWDLGTGALDDACGVGVSMQVAHLLKQLKIQPKRTIRVVGWVNEENGLRGGNAYRDRYKNDADKHVLAIESDGGVFKPAGFGFTGSEAAMAGRAVTCPCP